MDRHGKSILRAMVYLITWESRLPFQHPQHNVITSIISLYRFRHFHHLVIHLYRLFEYLS